MATAVSDGSGFSYVSGANAWIDTANAYDGSSTTFASLTTTSAGSHVVDITGYNFASLVSSDSTLSSVSLNVYQYVSANARWDPPTVQAYVGSTAIGSPQALGEDNVSTNQTTVYLSGLTLAQVRDANFKIRFTAIKAGAQSATQYLGWANVTVNYSHPLQTWNPGSPIEFHLPVWDYYYSSAEIQSHTVYREGLWWNYAKQTGAYTSFPTCLKVTGDPIQGPWQFLGDTTYYPPEDMAGVILTATYTTGTANEFCGVPFYRVPSYQPYRWNTGYSGTPMHEPMIIDDHYASFVYNFNTTDTNDNSNSTRGMYAYIEYTKDYSTCEIFTCDFSGEISGIAWHPRGIDYHNGVWVGTGSDYEQWIGHWSNGTYGGGPHYIRPCIVYATDPHGPWTVIYDEVDAGANAGVNTGWPGGNDIADWNAPITYWKTDWGQGCGIMHDGTYWLQIGFVEAGPGDGYETGVRTWYIKYSTSLTGPWSTATVPTLSSLPNYVTGGTLKIWKEGGYYYLADRSNTMNWDWEKRWGNIVAYTTNPLGGSGAWTGFTAPVNECPWANWYSTGIIREGGSWLMFGYADAPTGGGYTGYTQQSVIAYQQDTGQAAPPSTGWSYVAVRPDQLVNQRPLGSGRLNEDYTQKVSYGNGMWVLSHSLYGEIEGTWSTASGPTNKILQVLNSSGSVTWATPSSGNLPSGSNNVVSHAGVYWFATSATTSGTVLYYATSPGGTWQQVSTPSPPVGWQYNSYYKKRVAFDGTTYAVAVAYQLSSGEYSSTIWVATDQSSWTAVVFDNSGEYHPSTIDYLNGQWVMAGRRRVGSVWQGFIGYASSLSGPWTYLHHAAIGLPDISGATDPLNTQEILSLYHDGTHYGFHWKDNATANQGVKYATTLTGTWATSWSLASGEMNNLTLHNGYWVVTRNNPGGYSYTSSLSGSWTEKSVSDVVDNAVHHSGLWLLSGVTSSVTWSKYSWGNGVPSMSTATTTGLPAGERVTGSAGHGGVIVISGSDGSLRYTTHSTPMGFDVPEDWVSQGHQLSQYTPPPPPLWTVGTPAIVSSFTRSK